ncbi:uncharacterized protein LOC116018814 isoform X2 [Ipomoea triloba]|uniref:uncharacterized protein LOC116018814 isoform X2 n=1 Tax=Ipomoea triloba TaxID=35885 RepID=UPI00125D49F6|nr:uncharacterized protein LOC116018814 isoform X2 [Ipomoea triloba]
MVERFFPLPNPTDMSSCRSRSDHPIILLSGPPSSGKTSLLFQYALNSALEFNGAVVFICSRHKLDTKPPFLSQGIDPSSDIFQRIHIKYIDDDEGIKRYFAAFHIHHVNPVSVIIDDFADFFDERNCQQRYNNARGRDLAMVRTLALCRNAVDSAKESRPCQLLLSDTHQGDGFGSFLLTKSNYFGVGKSDGITTAKYSIALQYLVLEGISEGGEQ